jgi:hypothetical protein
VSDQRVCPFCGEPPGEGVFCAACGRNLAEVEQLPTREEWAGEGDAVTVAAFLAAMQAAGNPGVTKTPMPKQSLFKRAGAAHGWIVRPVDREDFEEPKRYEPGLVLSVEGRWYVLQSELRGWGQRDFPRYEHHVDPDPVEPPADARLGRELAAVLKANGVEPG